MKKHILSFLMLFTMISMTVAQPATMTKGNEAVDTLCQNRLGVEIVSVSGNNLDHPTHPATGIACPFFDAFTTSQTYSWYSWESSFFEHENSNTVVADVYYSGYIKVTVGNNYGHTGTDSIWFNIIDTEIPPMEDFIMEIDDDLHANFYGIAGPEHLRLHLRRGHEPGIYPHSRDFSLSPGEWIFNDSDATYSNDSLWMYSVNIIGICNSVLQFLVPGAILNVAENRNNNWFLEIKTILQNNGGFYASRKFVYFIYTIDEYGNRHLFQDQNGPIVLHYETTSWPISPDMIAHPFYQCGVAKELEDGSHQLFSLSNKVVNPYYPYYPYPYEALEIEDIEEGHTYEYCMYHLDNQPFIALLGETGCPQQSWELESNGEHFSLTGDSITVANPYETRMWDIVYHGCDKDVSFHILFYDPAWGNPFAAPVLWKHDGETVSLTALDDELYASGDIDCQWSTGEATNRIEATDAGTYSVSISAHGCSDDYSMELRDNVELALATVDLETGRDKVTWQVKPEQAEYIDKVKVIRYDGSAYNAPYSQGYYLFSGVENTPRNYHIVAVSKEGQNCPVISYERGTIHATCHESLDSIITLNWNIPYIEQGSPDNVIGFQICKYNSATQEVTVVKELDATDTHYSGDSSPFVGGRAVVAALFSNGERAFSNISSVLAVDENQESLFTIYPNPAQGQFTVEGTGKMMVTNLFGQTVLVRDIDGQTNVSLPRGMYFVKLGNATRKVVVE